MKCYLLFFFILITGYSIDAHPWKPKHYVIIDTDGGFDDYRAINLLLASPDVRVLAIIGSDGVLSAEESCTKVRSLLSDLHHEGLLVGIYNDSLSKVMNCMPAMDFMWGPPVQKTLPIPSAMELLDFILKNSTEKITFICLGSLSTINNCLTNIDDLDERLNRIIWTSDFEMDADNFNYSINPAAYISFTENNTVPLHIIAGDIGESVYTRYAISILDSIDNPYSNNIIASVEPDDTPYASRWYDESGALFLDFPGLYTADTSVNHIFHKFIPDDSVKLIPSLMKILDGSILNQNQVFRVFPMGLSDYQDDVQSIMTETVCKYGKEEWIAGVLANELHRHLGIYAIVGVKMGLRAREYFGAGIDEIKILSYAGQDPPFSCMNDGLQVSTGATMGHGLIHLDPDCKHNPGAEFTYLNQKIIITLKDEYRERIESQVGELSKIYGLNNDIYWALIRNAALYYWTNWDRNSIFDIKIVQGNETSN